MADAITCLRCGQNSFKDFAKPLMLPSIKIEDGELATDILQGLGVTAKYCTTCGYVEFTHILNNEHLAELLKESN